MNRRTFIRAALAAPFVAALPLPAAKPVNYGGFIVPPELVPAVKEFAKGGIITAPWASVPEGYFKNQLEEIRRHREPMA